MVDMPNIVLGAIVGLFLGVGGTLTYSHYWGEGAVEADWKSKVESSKSHLASTTENDQPKSAETPGASDESGQISALNAELCQQRDALRNDLAVAQQPVNSILLGQAIRNLCFEAVQVEPNLFLLKTRLNLTADQEAKLRQAMMADAVVHRQVLAQWLSGNRSGQVAGQAAPVADNVDQTLNLILSPGQQSQYREIAADQLANHAQYMATVEVNNVVPLLQLSDAQKETAMNLVYQVQLSEPDPLTQPNCAASFTSKMQKIQAALTQVLTPDQLALYQAQTRAFGVRGTASATQN